MTETILFGNLNSRKKYTKKVVVVNIDSSMRLLYYEKIDKKWRYITDDIDKIPCKEPRFMELVKNM